MVNSFKDVIDELGGVARLARALDVKPNTIRQARKRDSLAPRYFPQVVKLAAVAGANDITAERLLELAAAKSPPSRQAA